ncbi:MAG: hypothetical protein PHT02_00195 [Tissierellia bacterium]|nr:hypothetical protein [Tissierellia bacterium]
MKYLKYNHPASMKYNINQVYELEELKKELSIEMIKVLFEPIDFKFEDLESKKKVQKIEE